MFSHQQISTFLARQANSQQTLYQNLFEFIKKNTIIPEYIDAIKSTDPKLQQLRLAIDNANYDAEIFSDADCYFYLLYLIKKEKIPFYQGMTVYAFLMALMQFTNRQPLREKDHDVKFIRPMSIEKIAIDDKLTEKGEVYLKAVCANLKKMEYEIDYKKLQEFVIELAPTEQWLIKITTPREYDYKNPNHCDRMAYIFAQTNAFIESVDKNDIHTCWIPSTTLMTYFLLQISPNYMRMHFCFGSTNEETMHSIHLRNKHPIPLYAPAVKTNFQHADNWRCGPFVIWMHDMAHLYWTNLFSDKQRQTILEEYIPELRKLHALALKFKDVEAADKISKFIIKAGSFDLSGVGFWDSSDIRFTQYILSTIGTRGEKRNVGVWYFYEKPTEKSIGGHVEDRIYFLMLMLRNSAETSDEHKQLWETILTCDANATFGDIAETHRGGIMSALAKLANDKCEWRLSRYQGYGLSYSNRPFRYYDVLNDTNVDKLIDWNTWHEILENVDATNPDSEKLWKTILKKSYFDEQILLLICVYDVKFFHPFIPMTSEKLFALKQLVSEKIAAQRLEISESSLSEFEMESQFCGM
jgi:hypothetical protein